MSLSGPTTKKFLEALVVFALFALILVVSKGETQLFSLSESLGESSEFTTTLIYFGLINFNVVLILVLGFLIFRHVTKLIVERKRGLFGANLRTKLVFALMFFALVPTALLVYVSMQFITTSFDTWFSEKVHATMEQTKEAGSLVYKQDQKRLQSLARFALQRVAIGQPEEIFSVARRTIDADGLKGFSDEYGLSNVTVFDTYGRSLWSEHEGGGHRALSSLAIRYFLENSDATSLSRVVGVDERDVVIGAAPVRNPQSGELLAVVVTEVSFETQILRSMEKIISDFGGLQPGARLIQISYLILMLVVTLLIAFSAIWLGFYVARRITQPIQALADATREVALGNYSVHLDYTVDDETGQLVAAFNQMTQDLKHHQQLTLEAQQRLEGSLDELEQRRQYMEVVLRSIATGVISCDSGNRIRAINAAAEKFLGIEGATVLHQPISAAFSEDLCELLWNPVIEKLSVGEEFQGQVDLSSIGVDSMLMVRATAIKDEQRRAGFVMVLDDAIEQVREQRAVAWAEVARRIAHEIKNPITPIKLSAQRLLRRYHSRFEGDDSEVFEGCMKTIMTQVDSLRDLVNEFAKFSRMPKTNPRLCSLETIVDDVLKLFRGSYPSIEFVVRLEKTPNLMLDPEQFSRALVNLVTNAVAAVSETEKPRIEFVSAYLENIQTVRFEVVDNGCGIPTDLKEKVLRPYFSTKDNGTGLGLAIVHQVVADHGGYLRLDDNKPTGSRVRMELPARSGNLA